MGALVSVPNVLFTTVYPYALVVMILPVLLHLSHFRHPYFSPMYDLVFVIEGGYNL